jgi:hypothetical protein
MLFNKLIKLSALNNSSKLRYFLSTQTIRMKSFLINDPKYSFLKELNLSEKNNGVFFKHGNWIGDGPVSQV